MRTKRRRLLLRRPLLPLREEKSQNEQPTTP
jgi:hypothetical protein